MLLWVVKVLRRCWQTSDGPLMEGGLLLGHAVPVVVGAAGRQIDRRTAGWRRAVIGPGPSLRWWLGGPETPVGLAGDVALEDSHDLGLGEALVEASGDLGAGARLGAHAGVHDAPQRMVRLTVPAPVEAVSLGDLAGGGRQWRRPAQLRPGRFGMQPVGVVAGGDQQAGGGVDPAPAELGRAGCGGGGGGGEDGVDG